MGRAPILIFLVCAALAIAGCGSSDDSSSTASGGSTSGSEAASTDSTTGATSTESNAGDSTENSAGGGSASKDKPTKGEEESGYTLAKPGLTKPTGPPPKQLVKKDWIPGVGNTAEDGDEITVQYVGFAYKTGKEFDSSWDREEPLTFTLGSEEVISGWDQGIVGMKENGRRELIIPPDLAYGSAGSPPKIKPNETLVFMVDLVSVN